MKMNNELKRNYTGSSCMLERVLTSRIHPQVTRDLCRGYLLTLTPVISDSDKYSSQFMQVLENL